MCQCVCPCVGVFLVLTNLKFVLIKFKGCFKDIHKKFLGWLKKVSSVFYKSLEGDSRNFWANFKVFQESFKGVSSKNEGAFHVL